MVTAISEDSQAAKEAARVVVAFYIPAMPREQIERHGIDPDSLQPIMDAFNVGDVEKAIEPDDHGDDGEALDVRVARGMGGPDRGRGHPERV